MWCGASIGTVERPNTKANKWIKLRVFFIEFAPSQWISMHCVCVFLSSWLTDNDTIKTALPQCVRPHLWKGGQHETMRRNRFAVAGVQIDIKWAAVAVLFGNGFVTPTGGISIFVFDCQHIAVSVHDGSEFGVLYRPTIRWIWIGQMKKTIDFGFNKRAINSWLVAKIGVKYTLQNATSTEFDCGKWIAFKWL